MFQPLPHMDRSADWLACRVKDCATSYPCNICLHADDVKSPASRRLFNGIAMTADGCAPASMQHQRTQSPANGGAAASLAQPSAVYRSAPTSPQNATVGDLQSK